MAIEVRVPRLGWSMEEGTLTQWLKRDGDFVRRGDALFVLEGEKATQDIESFDEGVLRWMPGGPQEGDAVRVGQVVAWLLAEGEDLPESTPTAPQGEAAAPALAPAGAPAPASEFAAASTTSAAPRVAPAAGPAARRLARQLQVDLHGLTGNGTRRVSVADVRAAAQPAAAPTAEPHASPRARRRASELGIDWTGLAGTGQGGRVRERDVLAAAQLAVPTERRVPQSAVRRTIARRMLESHLATAPVTLTTQVDATQLVQLRQQFRAAAATSETIVPSYTDFLLKLVAISLAEHPRLNARWDDDTIVESSAVHLGIAVDTEAGLLVPVVRHVERLTVRQLSICSKSLVSKAHARRLNLEEMQGGTFTLTNLGSYGIDAFTPIIHERQCAILGVGRILKQPAVVDGQIGVRDLMSLSLTFDHRMVDGGPAARFLQTLCRAIENPAERLIG